MACYKTVCARTDLFLGRLLQEIRPSTYSNRPNVYHCTHNGNKSMCARSSVEDKGFRRISMAKCNSGVKPIDLQ